MKFYKKIIAILKYLWNLNLAKLEIEHDFKFRGENSYLFSGVRIDGARYISIGKNSTIQQLSWLYAGKHCEFEPELTIGENCAIGDFAHITAVKSVVIDDSVLIANKVYISDNLHEFSDPYTPIIEQPVIAKRSVKIGKGSWIGENVCIIGANVGKNSVIGSNAVVTEDIPDYCVAVGSPARVIKKYDFELKDWVKVK